MLLPPDVLGHLTHHPRPQRPQELRMVVSEVSLSRQEELALVAPCEFRPTLAVGDSSVPSVDCGRLAVIATAPRHLILRPALAIGDPPMPSIDCGRVAVIAAARLSL